MTTGSRIQGATDGPYYYNKTWSGGDGKYANGKLKKNAYGMSCTVHNSTKGSDATGAYITPGHGLYSQLVSWDSNDELKLLSKLSERARGHSFNMGVALAESSQTLQLVLTTLTRLTLATRAISRGDVSQALRTLGVVPTPELLRKHKGSERKARRSREFRMTGRLHQRDASSMFLEIQYGWGPLLQDVHEGMQAYAKHTNPPRVSQYKVTVRKTKERDTYPLGPGTGKLLTVHTRNTVSKTLTVTQYEQLSTARSLGLADPRSILWEKVPLSFVADWFIPIGSYLDSLATVPFIVASYQVVTRDTRVGDGQGGADPNYPTSKNYIGASAHGSAMYYDRSYPGSITVPLPKFKSMKQALSIGHIQNGIALLHQLLAPRRGN